MFNIFQKKNIGQTVTFKLGGMHCTSCAINIDGALEDTDGVLNAQTNYAKAFVKIEYNPDQVSTKTLKKVIKDQGYQVVE